MLININRLQEYKWKKMESSIKTHAETIDKIGSVEWVPSYTDTKGLPEASLSCLVYCLHFARKSLFCFDVKIIYKMLVKIIYKMLTVVNE